MPKQRRKLYVGVKRVGDKITRERFRSPVTPTGKTHGDQYIYCIGPFRTVAGAQFMAEHGEGNPHCQCVADAERLGRKYAVTPK